MRRAIELAMAGDKVALKLCLDRLLPARKECTLSVELPVIETVQDALAAGGAVAALVGAGELTTSEGQVFADIIDRQRRVVKSEELERRSAERAQDPYAAYGPRVPRPIGAA